MNNEAKIKYSAKDLSAKKYPIKELGIKPTLMKINIDRSSLYPVLQDMYQHVRFLVKHMSKNDQENIGRQLFDSISEAYIHFASSYYTYTMDSFKLNEAYLLLKQLEKIKFLTDACFNSDILNLDTKHKKGARNEIWITISAIQEQCEKWYNFIQNKVNQSSK